MAVASAWAKPGSWALAAEEQDDLPSPPPSVPAADFPSLATAAATKAPKKKKPQPVSLAEFHTFKPVASRGPTPDELLSLPTGPRERSPEELASARRWGPGRGLDELRRGGSGGPGGGARDFGPSRADEVDDWATVKKPVGMGERRDRMGAFGGDPHGSRADEVDDWVSTKKVAPAPLERRDRGFGDSRTRADESANWVSNKSSAVPPSPPADGRRGGPVWGFNRDGGPDSDSWGRKREEVSNGGGSSTGRPRLVLQKRTLPLDNCNDGEKKEEKKEEEEKWKPVTKSKSANPFGAARPREEVLAAKGEDWRKIDEKLEAMKVREVHPERRSFGRRGSPVAGEENGNSLVPESRAENAWRKPDAAEAAIGNEGSDFIDEDEPAN